MGHVFDDTHKTCVKHWPQPRRVSDKDQKKEQYLPDWGNSQITANEQKQGGKKSLKVQFDPEGPRLPLLGGVKRSRGRAAA